MTTATAIQGDAKRRGLVLARLGATGIRTARDGNATSGMWTRCTWILYASAIFTWAMLGTA